MPDFLDRVVTHVLDRVTGPLSFRLLLQPTMAIVVAMRAGLRDARAGRPPYLRTIWFDRTRRGELLRLGVKDVMRILVFATIIDVVYQVIVFRWVYPDEELLVVLLLAFVPYLIARGPANRIARRILRRGGAS
jgi:hypothetical protein